MKKNTYIKFGIDLSMAVTFVLFFNKRVLGGLTFHEIAGLVFGVVFITHVLLNWKWVINVTVKLFERKLPFKTKLSYFLNLLLLISMTFIIVSGIFISRVVFPNINIGNEQWFKISHMSISYLVMIIVAIHVGLHWHWVMKVFKQIFKFNRKNPILRVLAQIATAALLVFGCYQIYSTNFLTHLESVTNLFNPSSSQIEKPNFSEGDFNRGEKPPFQEGSFEKGERPSHPEGGFKDREGHSEDTNVLSVISTYFSIMSVFIIITYFLEKLIRNKRKKNPRPLKKDEVTSLT